MIKDVKLVGFISAFDRLEDVKDEDFEKFLHNNETYHKLKRDNLEPKKFSQILSTQLQSKQDIFEWFDVLTDINYITLKLIFEGVNSLLTDYHFALQSNIVCPEYTQLKTIKDAIEVSKYILERLPSQFPEQLTYYLIKDAPSAKKLISFLADLKKSKSYCFFLPLKTEVQDLRDFRLYVNAKHIGLISGLAIHPNNEYVISADNKQVLIHNLSTGLTINEYILLPPNFDGNDLTGIAFSNDGKYLAATFRNGYLQVWQTMILEEKLHLIEHFRNCSHAERALLNVQAINNHLFATVSTSGYLEIWSIEKGVLYKKISPNCESITDLAIFSDKTRIVFGGGATFGSVEERRLFVWDILKDELLFETGTHEWTIDNIVISVDETKIISTANETIYLWSSLDGTFLKKKKFSLKIHALAVHKKRDLLVISISDEIKVLNISTLEELFSIKGHHGLITVLKFDATGTLLISISYDQTIITWLFEKIITNQKFFGHSDTICNLLVTKDEQSIVSASKDKTIITWDITSRKITTILKSHQHWVTGLAHTSKEKGFFSISWDGTIRAWNGGNNQNSIYFKDEKEHLESISTSPNGNMVICGTNSGRLILFDEENKKGKNIHTFSKAVNDIKFNKDSTKVFIISEGGILYIFDTNDWKILQKYKHLADLENVDASYNEEEMEVLKNMVNGVSAFDLIDSNTLILATKDGELSRISYNKNTFKKHDIAAISCQISSLKYIEKYNYLITCSGQPYYASDNTLRLWNLNENKIIAQFTLDSPLTACRYVDENNIVVVGDRSGQIHFFKLMNI